MPTWLAHSLVLMCGLMVEWSWVAGNGSWGHSNAFLCHSPSYMTGWYTWHLSGARWHIGLLHDGILDVPLRLLWVPDATVHATLQTFCLGFPCQSQKRHLHLHHVPSLKQVIGLKQVHGVQAVTLMKLEQFSSWCQFCMEWLIWSLAGAYSWVCRG